MKKKNQKIILTKQSPKGVQTGLINFIINILKSLNNIVNKFTPLIWILQINNKIRSSILSFFTSFRIIRESFEYLNKLPVFQLMRKIIRFLSLISLVFNLFIFGIFTQFSPLVFISSLPGISQIGAFVYESSSENTQSYINWIALKIKSIILWVWIGIIDFIKAIIKSVLGEIDNLPKHDIPSPIIDPDKGKYGDINNDGYISKIYDYRFWILGGFIIIGIGAFTYLYWDSISWKKDGDIDPDQIKEPRIGEQLPSPNSSNGSTFSNYFRESIVDKVKGLIEKGKVVFRSKTPPIVEDIPSGLYSAKGKSMWNGLPLPRVETLENGVEYYISSDNNGLIKIVSNSINKTDVVEFINPITGRLVSSEHISMLDRVQLMTSAKSHAFFKAPDNSWVRNPIVDSPHTNVTSDISIPNIGSTSASTSNLPSLDNISPSSSEGSLTPKAGPINLDNIDVEEWT